MAKPEVWFAIPSANPANCRKVLPEWRRLGYKVAVLQNWERGEIPADIAVWSDTYPGWAGSINALCRTVVPREAAIVVSGGDDMLPEPDKTAGELAEEFCERFPDGFGVMQPHGDEFMAARRYCGSPWLGRKWIDTMYRGAGPMFPGYRHNWADHELFWVAKGLGALWERPDLSHKHEHFSRAGAEKPAYWRAAVEAKDLDDCRLYIDRSWSRFPGHEPVGGERKFDSSVLAQGALHLAEIRMAQAVYVDAGIASWAKAMTGALEGCAARGLGPVAIYGAGSHTRSIPQALMEPPVEVACIIDDNASRQGARMWGYPIVSMEEAVRRGVRAVVLSARGHEASMWDNTAALWSAGVEVVRLYPALTQEIQTRMVAVLERLERGGRKRVGLVDVPREWLADGAWIEPFAGNVACVVEEEAAAPVTIGGVPVCGWKKAGGAGIEALVSCAMRPPAEMDARMPGVRVEWLFAPKGWKAERAMQRKGVGACAC